MLRLVRGPALDQRLQHSPARFHPYYSRLSPFCPQDYTDFPRLFCLSTLPNFVLPGDVSASKRYWARDIISPAVEVSQNGTIAVSEKPGFGYEIDRDYLRHVTVREEIVA